MKTSIILFIFSLSVNLIFTQNFENTILNGSLDYRDEGFLFNKQKDFEAYFAKYLQPNPNSPLLMISQVNRNKNRNLNNKLLANINLVKTKYEDYSNSFMPCRLYDNTELPRDNNSKFVSNFIDNLINNYIIRDIIPKSLKSSH